MEIFDKRFVHFMWDDELKGKKVFMADGIDDLRGIVEKGGENDLRIVLSSGNESAPFQSANGVYAWKFAYYDPNYSIKKAFNEGKTIQFKLINGVWEDILCEENLIQAIEENIAVRVKPECPCEDGIDSKACVGCEHSENGKRQWRPYETVDEFIQDFQERFPTAFPRPAHTMPLIWIKNRQDGRVVLVHGFNDDYCLIGTTWITVCCLYENWIYLDGSPVEMEVKKK